MKMLKIFAYPLAMLTLFLGGIIIAFFSSIASFFSVMASCVAEWLPEMTSAFFQEKENDA